MMTTPLKPSIIDDINRIFDNTHTYAVDERINKYLVRAMMKSHANAYHQLYKHHNLNEPKIDPQHVTRLTQNMTFGTDYERQRYTAASEIVALILRLVQTDTLSEQMRKDLTDILIDYHHELTAVCRYIDQKKGLNPIA